ncbi:MAG: tetratricopeptide repeat protein [Rhodocyclaceae bacterium]|nr:MAG: tetratricopeptide repeat protein [Rhodocyclaceae bacterium]
MKPFSRRPIAFLLSGLLAGFVSAAGAAEEAPAAPAPAAPAAAATDIQGKDDPGSGLTGQILYQYLLAEIAASRGQMPLAASAYLDLARNTRDARIARRAAEVAFFGQQTPQALEATRLWLELEPDSAQARQTLWTLLANTGRVDELSAALSEALKAEGPNAGNALLLVNRVFIRVQDKAAVQRVVEQVSAPYLSLPEAHYARALAAVGAADEAKANAAIDEAIRLKPDWEAAVLFKAQLLSKVPEQSLAVVDALTSRSRDQKDYAEARLVRARLLVELKRYKEAQQAFAKLLEIQPDTPELLYAAGLLSLQVGDTATGEKHLRRLLAMNFGDKDSVRVYLGQAAEDRNSPEEALAYYDAVAPGHARYVSAQSRAAAILHSQGKSDEAMVRLEHAISANPKEKVQLLLAQVQLLSEKGKTEDAYGLLDKALAEQPEDPVLLYETSLMAEKLSRYEVLERNLRKLIKLMPDHAQAYNALGYSYADRNVQLEEARRLLDKALSLAPDDPFILDSRGWLDFRLGKLPEAEALLRKAAALRSDAEFAAHLGEVLWQQGKQDEARKVWDAAQKIDPANELLNSTRKRLQP